jgi:hypothetical protein
VTVVFGGKILNKAVENGSAFKLDQCDAENCLAVAMMVTRTGVSMVGAGTIVTGNLAASTERSTRTRASISASRTEEEEIWRGATRKS